MRKRLRWAQEQWQLHADLCPRWRPFRLAWVVDLLFHALVDRGGLVVQWLPAAAVGWLPMWRIRPLSRSEVYVTVIRTADPVKRPCS